MRSYIKIFYDFPEVTGELSDAERGRLIVAMVNYAATGEVPKMTGAEKYIFPAMKAQLDREASDYNASVENGKRGGRPAKTQKDLGFEKNLKNKTEPKNKNVTKNNQDKDKEEDKDKDKDKESNREKKQREEMANRSPVMRDAINKWLRYKAERKQKYEPTSLDTLLKKIDKAAEQYGEPAVIKLIDECIANHYQGIIWDRLVQQRSPGRSKQQTVTEEENQKRIQKDLEWLEQFSASSAGGGG